MRDRGNEILLEMAMYDPLNSELIDFLRNENLYKETVPEIEPPKPLTDETLLDFNADEQIPKEVLPENKDEEELLSPEDQEVELPGISETVFGQEMEDVESVLEADQEVEQETAQELEIKTEEILPPEEAVVEESYVEEPALDMEESATEITPDSSFDTVVDELFNEEEPAVDLAPIQDGTGLDLEDITGLTDTPEQERENFERNNIKEHLEEADSFSKPLDLNQFDNTEDDFSTLIEGYFQEPEEDTVASVENEVTENIEPEQPVEERSFLDTSVIFREKRSEDLDEKREETLPPEVVEDMNKVADEIEMMNTAVTFAVEKDIEDSAALHHELEAEETGEKQKDIDQLEDVIERIEKTEMPVEKTDDQFNTSEAAAFEDDEVNIEDILQNPSLLTPTFGEILIAQKKFKDAREVFNTLAKRESDNKRFIKKIEFLNKIVAMQK